MSKLFVVATPIGNLEDISQRALRILREVDLIVAEDTRVTKKILFHFQIEKPLISYHHHSSQKEVEKVLNLLKEGKDIALVTDAGTPGISDPGGKLLEEVLKTPELEVEIVPIPGPNAAVAALSISGFPTDRFLFLGFSPHKKGRKTFFQKIADSEHTVVFYESPHRIIKTLKEMSEHEELKNRQLVVARELTKKFETIYRGTASEILSKAGEELSKGELTIAVNTTTR
ncbi:MAG: 16S rRNA (cytidine(1402)-2'-O)-methyltransferase [Candidatus Yanofskybacteria bacterium]|nr:16S rRNA (cytidine(1402)-2'-O)-methyltransferase [Candidatus Yanofskybacteria bacterium]